MEIIVDDIEKQIEIWLSRSEKLSSSLRESLTPIFSRYKKMKYLVAVFESGDGELFDSTRDLLFMNKEI